MEEKGLEEQERQLSEKDEAAPDRVRRFLELIAKPVLLYETAHPSETRSFVEFITSNRVVDRKTIDISLVPPFSLIADRQTISNGSLGPSRALWRVRRPSCRRCRPERPGRW
jgi:hypothetical protein